MPDGPAFRSIPELARGHARDRGGATALVAGERSWTYAELHAQSSQVAQALRAAGVGAEDRVAFLDRNVPEYFLLLYGAAKLRAVTVGVNWRLAPAEMAYILNHARAKVLVIGREFLPHLAKMALDVRPLVVVVEGREGERPGWSEWVAGHEPADPGIEPGPEDTCYQLYTSGTTGLPKGVELTNANFFGMLPGAARDWRFDAHSISLVAMPLFHIAGSGWGMVGLFSGGTDVLLRDVEPHAILRTVHQHRVTNAFLVPAVLQVLASLPETPATDCSSMRLIVYGASPITEEVLVRTMRATRAPLAQAYGMTETTGAVTFLAPEDHDPGGPRAHLLRSAGRAMNGVELRIVDPETGEGKPDGEVGEVWTRSPQNLKGYFADPGATEAIFPEGRDAQGLGWLRTGDAGYVKDGFLFIHDRVKDMIVSGGENVYPAEVENALMQHPAVADVAVIGVPHEKWGETVKAVIVPAPGHEPSDRELIAFSRERLAHYKCPTSIDRVEAIPRNPSGKILKTELRRPYWEGRERMVN